MCYLQSLEHDDSASPAKEMQELTIGEEPQPSQEVSSSDDELKVLESQRAKRNQKKLIAKINSNVIEQAPQIGPS